MWKLPWISREHHAAVIAGKDEVIKILEAANAALLARLGEPVNVAVSVKLPEDLVLLQPAVVRKKREKAETEPARQTFDLTLLDENDPKALALYAAHEVGHPMDPYTLNAYITRLKVAITRAKNRRREREVDDLESAGPPAPQAIIDRVNAAARGEG